MILAEVPGWVPLWGCSHYYLFAQSAQHSCSSTSFPDTMVCTGCCSCLDHIVTYLFKQLSRSTKKRTTPLNRESDCFLHIMQQHPAMIQQVRSEVYNGGVSHSGWASPREERPNDSHLTVQMSLKRQWIFNFLDLKNIWNEVSQPHTFILSQEHSSFHDHCIPLSLQGNGVGVNHV